MIIFCLKPAPEELYDTINDPEELNNLANKPAYQKGLLRLRNELVRWQTETGDLHMQPQSQSVISYWDDFFVKTLPK